MFRNNIMLSNLAKNCINQLKNKTETLVCSVSSASTRRLFPQQVFSSNRTEPNDFHKPFTLNKKIGFWKGKREFSLVSGEKCWNCQQVLKVKKFSCVWCGALQYPNQFINYFELLGISQVYDIDIEDLSSKFRNLQMAFHPDKFASKSKEELEISEKYSRLINKAYTTLKDPLARGFYILELQKEVLINLPLGQDFLLSIMEKNEELENIKGKMMLELFLEANNKEVKKQRLRVSEAFRHRRWSDAKLNLLKLNYYINLDKKIKEKQNDFNLPKTM